MTWNSNMDEAPRSGKPIILLLPDGWEAAHWYEPWGNWVTEEPEDPEGEYFGIGSQVPIGWFDPDELAFPPQ